jgi:hypothetical protein
LNGCKMSWGDRPKQVRATESETRRSKDGQRDGERGVRFCLSLEAVGEECASFEEKGRGEVLYPRGRQCFLLARVAALFSTPLTKPDLAEPRAAIPRKGIAHMANSTSRANWRERHWLFTTQQVKPGA